MFLEKNIGPMDRTSRIIGGLALTGLGAWRLLRGNRGFVLSLLGASLLAEGLLGYCVIYGFMGISTRNIPIRQPETYCH